MKLAFKWSKYLKKNNFPSLPSFFLFFLFLCLRLFLVGPRTPFTGGAEVLLTGRRDGRTRWRDGGIRGMIGAGALRDWRIGLVFGLWVAVLFDIDG